jgi:hypothetical protein
LICFLLVLIAGALAFWKRWIRLHPAIAAPLVLVFLAYLTMPTAAATSSGADHRVPLLLGLLFVAGSRWTAPNMATARGFAAAALVLFLVRLAVVAAEWRDSDRIYSEFLPALDSVPAGSRVAVAAPPLLAVKWAATPLHHFPLIAVLRRDVFVPTLFANPTQQPVALRPHYRALAGQLGEEQLWRALIEGAPLDAGLNLAFCRRPVLGTRPCFWFLCQVHISRKIIVEFQPMPEPIAGRAARVGYLCDGVQRSGHGGQGSSKGCSLSAYPFSTDASFARPDRADRKEGDGDSLAVALNPLRPRLELRLRLLTGGVRPFVSCSKSLFIFQIITPMKIRNISTEVSRRISYSI